MKISAVEFILYVSNQEKSKAFYEKLLGKNASLDVPGMTEFTLGENLKLALMPNDGINKILKTKMPHPESGTGIPRCELYLNVENLDEAYECLKTSKALLISEIEDRDWGDRVCYFADLDGHIIALAEKL